MTNHDVIYHVTSAFSGFSAGTQSAELDAEGVLPVPLFDALKDGPDKLYAILDAGRVPFLAERLELGGLKGRMIYRSNRVMRSLEEGDDPLAEVSPWLIELSADDKIVRDFFCADPDENWQMMPARAGILLRSSLTPDKVLRRFMRLSQLPDEAGADLFFRFQEPGMLGALCRAVPTDVVASILDGISAVIWTEDTVIEGQWQAHILRPTVGLQSSGWHAPKIDGVVRHAFAEVINRRRAHLILRDSDIAPSERTSMIDDLVHLLGASQSSSDAMLHHLRLVAIAPPADRPYWRHMVDKGDISLAFINRRMHDHYIPAETFSK
ncbi:hypothetical protein FHS72_003549 [Loktanella ponticola]|uniref:DUF4123 domain-containing protein n=1 Tax=Yoonia ponticola TaxID=1524255 RepID=A0A7W9BP12_9RHOB|nr:DUF4123 domain-containing protein [Yoonia ponticola]MBB5723902.1 hypothetical protein [Yoonia ponticola]